MRRTLARGRRRVPTAATPHTATDGDPTCGRTRLRRSRTEAVEWRSPSSSRCTTRRTTSSALPRLLEALEALGRPVRGHHRRRRERGRDVPAAPASSRPTTTPEARPAPPELRPDGGDGGRVRPRARRGRRPDGRRPPERPGGHRPRSSTKLDEGYDVVARLAARPQGRLRAPTAVPDRQLAHRAVTGRAAPRLRLHAQGLPRRASCARRSLYGEMHRFLPRSRTRRARGSPRSPVQPPPADAGRSKYGIGRTFKVLLDLVTVKFLSVWSTKPSYVFGGSGAVLCISARSSFPGPRTKASSTASTSTASRRSSSASSSSRSA